MLTEFRARLIEGELEMVLFETMLARLREKGLLKKRGRMRTDSTHILTAVRTLNRLACVGETLRHALNMVATIAPDWLSSWVPADWFDRYSRRFEEFRLPDSREERYALGEQIGRDGHQLWEQLGLSADWKPYARCGFNSLSPKRDSYVGVRAASYHRPPC